MSVLNINAMTFVKKLNADETLTAIKVQGMNFAFSKSSSDSSPVGETRLEYKPCMCPKRLSRDPNAEYLYYPTEKDSLIEDCSEDSKVLLPHDPRYIQLQGWTVSAKDV